MLRRAVIRTVYLAFQPVQVGQPVARDLIPQVVDETRESIDIEQVSSDLPRKKERGHRKILAPGLRHDLRLTRDGASGVFNRAHRRHVWGIVVARSIFRDSKWERAHVNVNTPHFDSPAGIGIPETSLGYHALPPTNREYVRLAI